MGRKPSDKKRKQRLEKKRAKRKEKLKQQHKEKHRPLAELPLHKSLIVSGWQENRVADIHISRVAPDGNYTVCEFLVDLDGFGLRDCYGPRTFGASQYSRLLEERSWKVRDPADSAGLILAAVKWSRLHRFELPKDARRALDILPDPAPCDLEFGRDGEPFLSGDPDDIQKRLSRSGLKITDFACDFQADEAGHSDDELRYFTDDEYLATHDANDPLVRLERLAAMAQAFDQKGDTGQADELHATMRDLAHQADCERDFLQYLVTFEVGHECMDSALAIHQEIVQVSKTPEEKARSQANLADFTGNLGDAMEGDAIYRKVTEAYPDDHGLAMRYALFLAQHARQAEAKEKFEALIEVLKDNEEKKTERLMAFQGLYSLLKQEGMKAEAKSLYKQAKKEMKVKLQ